MRLLVIGGYGFIGSEIVRALVGDGHEVTALGRDAAMGRRLIPEARWIAGDLARMGDAAAWAEALGGIEAVINASGLLQGDRRESVTQVQRDAIVAMVDAAARAGVRRIVQVSAVGTDDAGNEFMASKLAADAALAQSGIDHVILRPGLVIGRNAYGGTALVRQAAALPFALLPSLGAPIQTVAMADVVESVRAAIAMPAGTRATFDLVSDPPLSLAQIVAAHRRWLGLLPTRGGWRVPSLVMRLASGVADALGAFGWRSPLRSNAIRALEQGVAGDPNGARALLGRRALTLDETLGAMAAGRQDRLAARIDLILPLLLVALAAMWMLSGIGTLVRFDEARGMLTATGIAPDMASAISIGGAAADIGLGLALLWRRWARPALLGMVVLTVAYLVAGTLLAPSMWLDPLAPFAKTLPAAVLAMVGFVLLEKR